MAQNHIIKKGILDITLDSEVGSFAFQSRVSEIFKTAILPMIDAYCSEINSESEIFRIDQLEIDLGKLDGNNFAAEFTEKMARLFPGKLAGALNSATVSSLSISGSSFASGGPVREETRDFELLEYFVRNGRLPWWVKTGEIYDIGVLLEQCVIQWPFKLKKMIADIAGVNNDVAGAGSGPLKRLVYYATDPSLEKIIAFFQPRRYHEIGKLSRDLIAVLTACPLTASLGTFKIRPEVWAEALELAAVSTEQAFTRRLLVAITGRMAKLSGADATVLINYLIQELKAKGNNTTSQLTAPDITHKPLEPGVGETQGQGAGITDEPVLAETGEFKPKTLDITAEPVGTEIGKTQGQGAGITDEPVLDGTGKFKPKASDISTKPVESGIEKIQSAGITDKPVLDGTSEFKPKGSDISAKPVETGIDKIQSAGITDEPALDGTGELKPKILDITAEPVGIGIGKTQGQGAGITDEVPGIYRQEDQGSGITDEPAGLAVTDFYTREYLQQLFTVENLLQEFQREFIGRKGTSDSRFSARPGFESQLQQLANDLPRALKSLQEIRRLIRDLLIKTGRKSIFTLEPLELDERLVQQAGEFEAQIEKFQREMRFFLDNDILTQKPDHDLLQKIVNSMEAVKEIKTNAIAAEVWTGTDSFTDSDEIYIHNAGLILLWPYLPRFFETLGLAANGGFLNEASRERAVLMLQYLACGHGETPEYDLTLNKILCGIAPVAPVQPHLVVAEPEMAEAENLLQAVIYNWPVLKNVSIPGLRGMFLIREGLISVRDGHWLLRVEEQAQDVLLDRMPWGISTIKLPWMEELLFVEWRL